MEEKHNEKHIGLVGVLLLLSSNISPQTSHEEIRAYHGISTSSSLLL